MRPSRASTRVPVSPAYARNPAGQPIRGSGHSASFPTPDSVAVTAMGSPTRPLGGSSRRSRLSPRATAGGSPAARAPGSGSTCTGTVSLRNEKRSSRLKNEKLAGTAYSTVAGGMTIRPGASGNTATCATNRSSQRPRTRRVAATSPGAAPGNPPAPSGVRSARIRARRSRAPTPRGHPAPQGGERRLRARARSDGGEARGRGGGEVLGGGGSGAGADGGHQAATRRDVRPVQARGDVGRRPALQRGEHPEREDHQSFTPGSTARRVCPVRSRRVLSSCWPIERNTSSACAGLMPPCTPAPPWARPLLDPPPPPLWGAPPPPPGRRIPPAAAAPPAPPARREGPFAARAVAPRPQRVAVRG